MQVRVIQCSAMCRAELTNALQTAIASLFNFP